MRSPSCAAGACARSARACCITAAGTRPSTDASHRRCASAKPFGSVCCVRTALAEIHSRWRGQAFKSKYSSACCMNRMQVRPAHRVPAAAVRQAIRGNGCRLWVDGGSTQASISMRWTGRSNTLTYGLARTLAAVGGVLEEETGLRAFVSLAATVDNRRITRTPWSVVRHR